MRLLPLLALLAILSVACSASKEVSTTTPISQPIPNTPTLFPTPSNEQPTPFLQGNPRLSSIMDVTYCTVNGVELKMDVYFPAIQDGPAPAVVYVHGGGWSQGDKNSGMGNSETSLLTDTGFVVFAVNYRLAPEYRFPAMIEDVKCAIRSIRAHSAGYNVNPDRIGAFGASAGGHLVSLLGTSDIGAGFDVGEYLEYSSRVQAVVDLFGPADLTLQNFNNEQIQNAGQVFTADQLVPASPVTYISPDDPPFLILHGDRDGVVPLEQSQALYDALTSGGVSVELVIVQNAGHGFQSETDVPIQPTYQQISQMIVEFFEGQLK